ncbi:MAG: trehalase family glycosidase [Bacteroidota bacterium]
MNKSQLASQWDNLVTSIDQHGYTVSLNDPKVTQPSKTVFVEDKDPFAMKFYEKDTQVYDTDFSLQIIPNKPDERTVQKHRDTPGIVAAVLINNEEGVRATPYTYLGEGYTELDVAASYFHILGLLKTGRLEQAKQLAGNITYMVGHVHSLKATNRIYHQHVRALPLYSAMIRAISGALPQEDRPAFLKIHIVRSILDYFRNWHASDSQLVDGLNIYPKIDVDQNTLSFHIPPEHTIPVRLNMMLYNTEMDIAHFLENYVAGGTLTVEDVVYDAAYWKERGHKRLEKMWSVLWNKETETFNDYDISAGRHTHLDRADFIYALWADAISDTQFHGVKAQISKHTNAYGLLYDLGSTTGQAPEQIISWIGLEKQGLVEAAQDLREKWQRMVLEEYNDKGVLALRYDMETGIHKKSYGTLYGWTLASLFL